MKASEHFSSRVLLVQILIFFFLASSAIAEDQGNVQDYQTDSATYGRVFYLLKNKGFLDEAHFTEISQLADRLPLEDRKRLYSYFKTDQLWFLPSLTLSRFEFFPKFEDNTPNIAFGVAGLVGVGMLAYIFTTGIHDDNQVSAAVIGISGWALALAADVYFVGRPIFIPRAYNSETINATLAVVLRI